MVDGTCCGRESGERSHYEVSKSLCESVNAKPFAKSVGVLMDLVDRISGKVIATIGPSCNDGPGDWNGFTIRFDQERYRIERSSDPLR